MQMLAAKAWRGTRALRGVAAWQAQTEERQVREVREATGVWGERQERPATPVGEEARVTVVWRAAVVSPSTEAWQAEAEEGVVAWAASPEEVEEARPMGVSLARREAEAAAARVVTRVAAEAAVALAPSMRVGMRTVAMAVGEVPAVPMVVLPVRRAP